VVTPAPPPTLPSTGPLAGISQPSGSSSPTQDQAPTAHLVQSTIPSRPHPFLERFRNDLSSLRFTDVVNSEVPPIDCYKTYSVPPLPPIFATTLALSRPAGGIKEYRCPHPSCSMVSSNNSVYEGHVRIAHLRLALGCPVCEKRVWKDFASWRTHLRDAHSLDAPRDTLNWAVLGHCIRVPHQVPQPGT